MRVPILARIFILFSLLIVGSALAEGPPTVDLSLVSETEGLEPGKELILYAFVTNKSDSELTNLSLDALKGRFEKVGSTGLKSSLGPFESTDAQIHLRVKPGEVSFGKYQVPFALSYHWRSPQSQAEAPGKAASVKPPAVVLEGDFVQRAIVAVEVTAPYSAVASGLPGGSGPLFWLLLPVIPAFLAFQLVQGLRRKQGPQIPTFSAENVLPAFFIAIVVNSLPFWSTTLAKLSTIWLLAGSALLGALWPAMLWFRDWRRWRRWAFRDDDTPEDYFRKALLSRWVSRPLVWATGTVGKSQWSGFLLTQPDGSLALGAGLQVSPKLSGKKSQEEKTARRKDLEDLIKKANQGASRDRRKLFREHLRDRITMGGAVRPTFAGEDSERLAVTGPEVKGFEREKAERKPLLAYSQ